MTFRFVRSSRMSRAFGSAVESDVPYPDPLRDGGSHESEESSRLANCPLSVPHLPSQVPVDGGLAERRCQFAMPDSARAIGG